MEGVSSIILKIVFPGKYIYSLQQIWGLRSGYRIRWCLTNLKKVRTGCKFISGVCVIRLNRPPLSAARCPTFPMGFKEPGVRVWIPTILPNGFTQSTGKMDGARETTDDALVECVDRMNLDIRLLTELSKCLEACRGLVNWRSLFNLTENRTTNEMRQLIALVEEANGELKTAKEILDGNIAQRATPPQDFCRPRRSPTPEPRRRGGGSKRRRPDPAQHWGETQNNTAQGGGQQGKCPSLSWVLKS